MNTLKVVGELCFCENFEFNIARAAWGILSAMSNFQKNM